MFGCALFRGTVFTGVLLAGLFHGTSPLAAQRKPYTIDDLLTLVRGGVAPVRIGELADRSCLAFVLDRDAEAQLCQSGAIDQVVERLSRACVVTPGPRLSLGASDLVLDPSFVGQVRLNYGIRSLVLLTYDNTIDIRVGNAGGRRTFTLISTISGADINERSETVVDAQTLAALSYTLRRVRTKGVGLEMELRRDGDRIRGWAAASNGARANIDEPVFENSTLPGAEELILESAALAPGQAFSFSSFSTSTARACTINLKVEGERSIRVPAGTFDTYQIRVSGCNYDQKLYVRKEAPHITIKQDFTTTKVDLRSITH